MSKWSSAFRDSRWQKLRLEIMERDKWYCQSCGNSGDGVTLNVHHSYYESGKAPWEYPKESLITYCEECHTKRHKLQNDLLVRISRIAMPDFVSTLFAVEYFPKICAKVCDTIMGNGVPSEAITGMLDSIEIAFNAGSDFRREQGGEE